MSTEVGGKLQFIGTVEDSSSSGKKNATNTGSAVATNETPSGARKLWNPLYFKTWDGVCKLVEMSIATICIACLPATSYTHHVITESTTNLSVKPIHLPGRQILVTVTAILVSTNLLWCISFVFNLWRFVPNFQVKVMNYLYCLLSALSYFVVTSTYYALNAREEDSAVIDAFGDDAAYIAAGVFGIINGIVYGLNGFYLYKTRHMVSYGPTAET